MKFIRLFLLAATLAALAFPAHAARQKPRRPEAPAGTYKGAIVLDAADGRVLFENKADVVNPPASMTKLMTFAVVSDRLRAGAITLSTPVRITADDARMGGTRAYLDPRETFSVEELMYAMMIRSANDAAHALARAAGGSRPAFIELMNAKAAEIGMRQTTFRTPHGLTSKRQPLNEGDLTTPRDFARLCYHLIRNTDVLKYTSVRVRDFAPDRVDGAMRMENHNKLLGKVAGVDGLKTGYTQNAGYCLSATAERNGRRVILVIMGAFGPKGAEIDLGKSRDLMAIDLIDRGFAALPLGTRAAGTPTAAPVSSLPSGKIATPKTVAPQARPIAKPAPSPIAAAPSAPLNEPPLSPVAAAPESSPVQPAANPVEPATSETSDAPPTVKFVLPPQKKS